MDSSSSTAEPDFYMSSCEYDLFREPRTCYVIKRFRGGKSAEFLLVRIEPPIPAGEVEGYDRAITEVAIKPRHVGVSLFPITKCPVYVHVALPVVEGIDYRSSVVDTEIGVLYPEVWAELYPTSGAQGS